MSTATAARCSRTDLWTYNDTPSALLDDNIKVEDWAIDQDRDGLTDDEEAELGTDPQDADTDSDGLGDGDEVNTHGTDPLDSDTDGDCYGDGTEVGAGSDPRDAGGIPTVAGPVTLPVPVTGDHDQTGNGLCPPHVLPGL